MSVEGKNPTGIILPDAKTDLSKQFIGDLKRLDPFFQKESVRGIFYPALVTAVNALKPNTDYKSMMVAAMNCAAIQLVPGTVQQHCWILAYDSEKLQRPVAQVIVGYKGWMELGFRSKHLDVLHQPKLVLDGDEFDLWSDETGPRLRHRPADPYNIPPGTRENVVGAYVCYKTKGGASSYAFVPRSEIDKVDSKRNVWKSDYASMCMKTAIHRAAKTWRSTPEMGAAHEIDETDNAATDQIGEAAERIIQTSSKEAIGGRVIGMMEAKLREITADEAEWPIVGRFILGESVSPEHLKDAQFAERFLSELRRQNRAVEDIRRQSGVN